MKKGRPTGLLWKNFAYGRSKTYWSSMEEGGLTGLLCKKEDVVVFYGRKTTAEKDLLVFYGIIPTGILWKNIVCSSFRKDKLVCSGKSPSGLS